VYTDGPYVLRIERKNGEENYSASDGQHTIPVPIPWAFGLGDAGQTYVFERDGIYYESLRDQVNEDQKHSRVWIKQGARVSRPPQ